MITEILKRIFGDKSTKDQKLYQPYVDQVLAAEQVIQGFNDDELREKSFTFRTQIKNSIAAKEAELASTEQQAASLDVEINEKEELFERIDRLRAEIDGLIEEELLKILPEAFAVVKETAKRWANNGQLTVKARDFDRALAAKKDGIELHGDQAIWRNEWTAAGNKVLWNMVHYNVQLMGGAVLHKGNIAEMQTGEGKTLVATLPVYLNALAGKGVHVVTVNDYLAKRDSEWMGPLYQFHGLSVDCIDKHTPNSEARRNAYLADITFGTNNEFGFDYLRDNMVGHPSELVQRKHHFAIVDEVDSVLIDDARTPLIISGPTDQRGEQEFQALKPRIERIVNAQREVIQKCLLEAKKNLVVLNELQSDKKLEKSMLEEGGIALLRAHRGLPKNKALIKYLSEPGVKVHLQKTENHYLQEQGKHMKVIDQELFFVIDEKNNSIELTSKGIDLISGNDDKDFFIMPDIGAELAKLESLGLEQEAFIEKKDALVRDYSIKSERIHSVNQLLKAYTLFEKEVEYVILDGKVKIVDESTGRILEGRRYSDGLHQAIEAKENVTIEAATQTYATITLQNYFRMYHKLAGMTGTAETEAKEFFDIYALDVVVIPTHRKVIRKDDNDMVYKTAREKFGAVIDEVAKLVEEGRPVLVGTTTVEISELLSKMLHFRKIPHQVLNAKYHQKEAEIVANAGKAGAVTIATNMAGRGTDIKLGEGVKEAGGLAIVGTERHDSRRVDRQLRGRSGRQGDPGTSQFFVSLEDDLMRKFGSERIAKIMDRMGLKEGEVITHSMVSKSIERAQKKVEENNFGIRKRLLEYDDVMNAQRKKIYKLRKNALNGDRLDIDVDNMFYDLSRQCVERTQHGNYSDFELELLRLLGIVSPVDEDSFKSSTTDQLTQSVYESMLQQYQRKQEKIVQRTMPQIKEVYETMSDRYKNIVFPLSDGVREIQLIVNLQEAYESQGKLISKQFEKHILLGIIDNEWKEHLREMDDLRSAVNNATYEQKDPLVIYKLEAYNLFESMISRINQQAVELLMNLDIPADQSMKQTNSEATQRNYAKAATNTSMSGEAPRFQNSSASSQGMMPPPVEKKNPIVVEPKINRNDPCPCGSGKKFKQCHGK
ncbi:MAG: preprotein translocase subunit SecA [Flavobacteriia bacterium]|jgi:preprotein translocase subunit SecA|nr:preprotein translocase subunit SecA [Flavobacteriia bacterium]